MPSDSEARPTRSLRQRLDGLFRRAEAKGAPARAPLPAGRVYVDLAYLHRESLFWRRASRVGSNGQAVFQVDPWKVGRLLSRGFDSHTVAFYDAVPEDPVELADPRFAARRTVHAILRRSPHFQLRLRRALERPYTHQAEVDIAIACDMLQDAEHCKQMVLLSGDRDFVPLVEALRGRGVHVTVAAFFQHHDHWALRRAANATIDLDSLPVLTLRDCKAAQA